MTKGTTDSNYDGLSKFIKLALDAGFTELAYSLLALVCIGIILFTTYGRDDDRIITYFRYLLLAGSVAPIGAMVYGCVRVCSFTRAARSDASKNIQPPV